MQSMAVFTDLHGLLHLVGWFLLVVEDMEVIYFEPTKTNFVKKIFLLGWINDFLSWGVFVPLSRLSYIIYLVHLTIVQITFGTFRSSIGISNTLAVRYIYQFDLVPCKFFSYSYIYLGDFLPGHLRIFNHSRIYFICQCRASLAEHGEIPVWSSAQA
jgi:hypothetical protein